MSDDKQPAAPVPDHWKKGPPDGRWPNFNEWHAHSARQANDYQAEMAEQYRGPRGDRVCQVFASTWTDSRANREIFVGAHGPNGQETIRTNDPEEVASMLREATVYLATEGSTLWMSDDIRLMISAAAHQLGDEPLRYDDPPYSEGMVWLPVALDYWSRDDFQSGVVVGDIGTMETRLVRSNEFPDGIPLVAIGWVQNMSGMLVYCFTATSRDALNNGSPRVLLVDLWQWDFDRAWAEVTAEEHAAWKEAGGGVEDVPRSFIDRSNFPEDTEVVYATPWLGNTRRFLLALWRFMSQEIIYVEADHDRATVRRGQRAGKRSGFHTIKLRRVHKQGEDHVPGTVHWTCRWIQKGHWRTLYRGTDKQRKVWVSPGVKGPEGAPMKISHNVVSIER